MSKRDRQRKEKNQPIVNQPAMLPGNPTEVSWFRGGRAWLVAVVVPLVVFVTYKCWTAPDADDLPAPVGENRQRRDIDNEEPPAPKPKDFHGHHPSPKPEPKKLSDNFLDDFNQEKTDGEKGAGGSALANNELEKQLQSLLELNDQINELKKREAEPGAFERQEDQEEHDRLVLKFDLRSAALDKEARQAAQSRPEDAVPRWVTGELLALIGGDSEAMLRHLEFAFAHGLNRPRLLASMARAHLAANQFADAYRYAVQAVENAAADRYEWETFMRAVRGTNQFDQAVERLDRAFPTAMPGWAKSYRREAADLQAQWAVEQKLRLAEARADDLPRVRLVIEHRRFARDATGQPLTTVESTGHGEVILELFENEAPKTVANFIDLVEHKFYDGTRFHLAIAALLVAGGDPNSKKEDPSLDGAGGPGYVIPDEFKSAGARNHFHGSISMLNTGPRKAGSQFFFTLLPLSRMNGYCTVFGRIVQGQDVVDQITRGRTTPKIGTSGRIVPGDLLVRAEVIRKRPHEYRAIKEQP